MTWNRAQVGRMIEERKTKKNPMGFDKKTWERPGGARSVGGRLAVPQRETSRKLPVQEMRGKEKTDLQTSHYEGEKKERERWDPVS